MVTLHHSFGAKILALLLPTVVLVMLGGSLALATIESYRSVDEVQAKLHSLASIHSLVIADPLWNFREEAVQKILEAIVLDSDVAAVLVFDEGGNVSAQAGVPPDHARGQSFLIDRPIIYESALVKRRIGRLRLVGQVDDSWHYLFDRIVQDAVLLVMVVGVLLVGGMLAYRRIIERPLKRFLTAVAYSGVHEASAKIPWRTNDELGQIVDAYNCMLDRLEAKQREFQTIFEAVPAMLWYLDREHRVVRLNHKAAEGIGVSPEETVGKTLYDLLPERVAREHVRDNEEVFVTGAPKIGLIASAPSLEKGKVRWSRIDRIPSFNEKDEVDGVLVFVLDVSAQKHAEEQVRESERLLLETQRIAHLGSWELEVASGRLTWSEETFRIVGLNRDGENLRLSDYEAVMFPEDLPEFRTSVKWAVEMREPFEIELRHMRPDGRVVYALMRGHPVVGDGEVRKVIGSLLDITDGREAEAALRTSKAELQAVFDGMTDLVFLMDYQGRYLKIAAVSQDLFYRPSGEIVGKTVHDVFAQDQADYFLSHIRRCIDSGRPVALMYSLTFGDEQVWFDSRISPLPGKRVVFVARDVTEFRKQMALLENVLANLPNQVFWKDRNLRYMGCNRRFAELVGKMDSQDIVGKSEAEVVGSGALAEKNSDLDRKVIQTGEGYVDREEPYWSAGGEERFVLTSRVPLRNETGEVYGVLGISTDITERKRAEREIHLAKESAEAANRAKSEFLANMSHEIRTPLNPIVGLTHMALQANPQEPIRDYLDKIQSASRSLLAIINDILDFSKIEAGMMTMETVEFSLDAVVEGLQGLYGNKAEEKNLAFAMVVADAVPRILVGDPLRLQQVLGNLVSNAIKFTEQGWVRVTVTLVQQGVETA